jgi:hypothetical protein
MNTTPRSPTPINTTSYSSEKQQLIWGKSENFVGCEFVFAAINEFLHRCAHGYFTLIGVLGSGKSAILGKYVKLWHLDAGEVITSFTDYSSLFYCAFAPDRVTILAGDALGRMHFLRLEGSQ